MYTKTEKMKTATKKLVMTKSGQINKSIINSLKSCRFYEKENKIYPVSYRGSGRYINKSDHSATVRQILEAQGYKFEIGNDAPRGGENGLFFKMSTVAFNFLQGLKSNK